MVDVNGISSALIGDRKLNYLPRCVGASFCAVHAVVLLDDVVLPACHYAYDVERLSIDLFHEE